MDFEAYIDAVSEAIDLPVAAAHRPGTARFLGLAAEMAALLEAVPLDDGELVLAPVFRLPEPGESADG
ncbi:AtzG-like protein [Oceanicella sp. SM1341]|uniref:AtzG-like protein n=1 Tax=Oceanicella sp. SM1341 TaxID=1548889 RepID=UPI0018E53AC6|nr:AtzG-like protein [Oceanicella sp. SM1341]